MMVSPPPWPDGFESGLRNAKLFLAHMSVREAIDLMLREADWSEGMALVIDNPPVRIFHQARADAYRLAAKRAMADHGAGGQEDG